jgi:hypothetical protein
VACSYGCADYLGDCEEGEVMIRVYPKHGDFYRHFKGKMYEVIECPVTHTETGE